MYIILIFLLIILVLYFIYKFCYSNNSDDRVIHPSDYYLLESRTFKNKFEHSEKMLRSIGAKYKIPVITGVQVSKDAWNANDITLEQVPESKAIAETADTFFAIIRTEEMKRNGFYRFKLLKQRDGDFLKSQIKINLNSTYLTLENDIFLDAFTN